MFYSGRLRKGLVSDGFVSPADVAGSFQDGGGCQTLVMKRF